MTVNAVGIIVCWGNQYWLCNRYNTQETQETQDWAQNLHTLCVCWLLVMWTAAGHRYTKTMGTLWKGFGGLHCSMLFCSAMVFDECKNLLLKALILLYTATISTCMWRSVSWSAVFKFLISQYCRVALYVYAYHVTPITDITGILGTTCTQEVNVNLCTKWRRS